MHARKLGKPSYLRYQLAPEETIQDIFTRVKSDHYDVLLESSKGYTPKTSQYSIISLLPEYLFTLKDAILTVQSLETFVEEEHYEINSWKDLKTVLESYLASVEKEIPAEISHLPFMAGYLGFISYDFVRLIEKLPQKNAPSSLPACQFILTQNSITYDHQENQVWVVCENQDKLDYTLSLLEKKQDYQEDFLSIKALDEMNSSFSENDFVQVVNQAKEYIAQGEIYQSNLSIAFSQTLELCPYKFYQKLYSLNPSPFCCYVHFGKYHIVSNSPERLVKARKDGIIETRPIAGTRGRKGNLQGDKELEKQLTANIKERSEHVMLVDLERNDLGKVAKYGSVEVDELLVVEKYSHVMHLVSNVVGELSSDQSFLDLIPAMFPGGTITGVPKVRCMEIIEELEPVSRGIYTGSVGYIDFRGNLDFSIIIRTMMLEHLQDSTYKATMSFGAGIVADSVGEYEYKECIKKGKAIFSLLESLS